MKRADLTSPLGAALRVRVLRSGGLFGKDLLRGSIVFAGMLLIAALMILVVWMLRLQPEGVSMPALLSSFLIVGGFTFGFALLYEEFDGGTWRLLRALPLSPGRVVAGKLLAACLLLALFAPALAMLFRLLPAFLDAFVGPVIGRSKYATPLPAAAFSDLDRETPVLVLSALLAGLVAPLVFPRNLVLAVVAGSVAVWGWFRTLGWVIDESRLTLAGREWVGWGGSAAWVVLMLALLFVLPRFRSYTGTASGAARMPRSGGVRPSGFRTVPGRLMNVPVCVMLLVMGAMALYGWWSGASRHEFAGSRMDTMAALLLLAVGSVLVGVNALDADERHLPRHQVFHLPVSRSRLILARAGALLWRLVLLAVVGLVAGRFAFWPQLAGHERLVAGIVVVLLILAGGMLGFAMRPFVRLRLLTGLPAMVTLVGWVVAVWVGVTVLRFQPAFHVSEVWAHAGWLALVVVLVPLALAWVALAGSRLCEQSERRRDHALGVAVLLLLSWGVILLFSSPQYLLVALIG